MSNVLDTSHEFGSDIIPKIINRNRVFAFAFKGYWAYARTIETYFHTNMDLLNGKINLSEWQIRTNLLERCAYFDRMPARISENVTDAVVSEGCIVQGTVKNSILSPGVVVKTGAEITDSIIFHDTIVEKQAKLHKVICDKDSVIGEECVIGGFGEDVPSREFPDLLNSGITLLGRNSTIPAKTKIGANTTVYASAHLSSTHIEPGSTIR
jgi:glucose-1-phosphate adenylyltransferase